MDVSAQDLPERDNEVTTPGKEIIRPKRRAKIGQRVHVFKAQARVNLGLSAEHRRDAGQRVAGTGAGLVIIKYGRGWRSVEEPEAGAPSDRLSARP